MAHVFIFRRDFRIYDNLAWNKVCESIHGTADYVLPIFIFNPMQIDPKNNKYFNKSSVEFMIQSLRSLEKDLNHSLSFFHGDDISVLQSIKSSIKDEIKSVSFNADYTPFAIKRDKDIVEWCEKNNIAVHTSQDYTLLPINTVMTGQKTFFSVFTPFYRKMLSIIDEVPAPYTAAKPKLKTVATSRFAVESKHIDTYYMNNSNPDLYVKGGRDNGRSILAKIERGEFKQYDHDRDFPYLDKTTKMSAYLKFGCISVREAFAAIKKAHGTSHGLVRELIWREFYANITFNKPRVLGGQIGKKNLPFKEKYDAFKWQTNKTWWNAFVSAQTGFPFIDAGIRMLYKTGFCPNRLRMVLAMFATKDLLTDPVVFEKWFAQNLVDYDPSSNSGGVLWSASTGVDAQPYFRIFSPILQTERFDPEAKFIKLWIPELEEVPVKDILKWDKSYSKYPDIKYPSPIVNHTERSKIVIQMFKEF